MRLLNQMEIPLATIIQTKWYIGTISVNMIGRSSVELCKSLTSSQLGNLFFISQHSYRQMSHASFIQAEVIWNPNNMNVVILLVFQNMHINYACM
jgi:hypothetical protein